MCHCLQVPTDYINLVSFSCLVLILISYASFLDIFIMVALFGLKGRVDVHDEEHHHAKYPGSGTPSDPYIVEFNHNDARNPLNFTLGTKVLITFLVTISVFAVTLTSSAYSGSAEDILRYFHTEDEIFALGIALFVLGFAIGPALWAPLSELYGRRILFIGTHAAMAAVVAGTAGCKSITALMILRYVLISGARHHMTYGILY
jgi:hypothetical protein